MNEVFPDQLIVVAVIIIIIIILITPLPRAALAHAGTVPP